MQQDGAPAHTAISTQNYLATNVPDFINKNQWPPHSPDVAVLDYSIIPILKERVYQTKIKNLEHLREVIVREWNRLPMAVIQSAIDVWHFRLRLVVNEQGSHFEHML